MKLPPLTGLSAEDREDLAALVDAALAAQRADLRAALEAASGQVPWLLRGPLRKVLGL